MPCGLLGFVSEDKGNVLVVEESGFSVFWTRAWQLTASAFLPSWQVGQLAPLQGGSWPEQHPRSPSWALTKGHLEPRALTTPLSMLKVLLGTLVPDLWSQALPSASSETFKR